MSKGVSQYEKCSAEVRMMQRARKVRKAAMRKRLAARDAACAENAAPVTVEVRGNVVTEWRGQRVIGCHATDHIRHS